MSFTIFNKSDLDMSQMRPLLKSFMPFAQKKIGFDRPVSINFVSDLQNANLPLGKTGYYDPNNSSVCIYTDKRHPKDIMRSLSHELVHHGQNCRGEFDRKPEMGEGYFQRDGDMRELEREAYEKGNMCFREWEETYKKQLQESIYYQTGDTKMSLKEWKDQELFDRLLENYGYKKPEPECITHLCAMQVKELASGRIGHPINHTLLEDGTVTHYDVEFDNVIVEGMPVSALETTVLETHGHVARREDNPHGDKPREQYMEEEELEEGEAKPDFLDLDKDGDKDEPMKAAAEEVEEGLGSIMTMHPMISGDDVEDIDEVEDKEEEEPKAKPRFGTKAKERQRDRGRHASKLARFEEDLDEAKIREFIRGAIKKKLGK